MYIHANFVLLTIYRLVKFKNHVNFSTHYVEYLSAKVAKARIDPLPIFDLTDCVQELRRRGIPLPERGPWDTDEIYKGMCSEVRKLQSINSLLSQFIERSYDFFQIIKQKIPLETD